MSTYDDTLAIVLATIAAETVARSGFPGDLHIATTYNLGGPLIGTHGYRNAVQHVSAPTDLAEVVELVYGLGSGWAAAVLDDGHVCLTNNQANAYIRPGIYLPNDVTLITGQAKGDDLFWRYYGWPAAERLVAYAQHYGWLGRINAIVAPSARRRELPKPFDWVRPVVGDEIALIEFDPIKPLPGVDRVKPLCGRTGRHRFEVTEAESYFELIEELDATRLLHQLAKATIASATRGLAELDGSVDLLMYGKIPGEGGITYSDLLRTVAEANPAEIIELRHNVPSGASHYDRAFGLSADAAPAWARCLDRAYLYSKAQASAMGWRHYEGARGLDANYDGSAKFIALEPEELQIRLDEYVRAMTVSVAIEAILLWSADPLPVADIRYAVWWILHPEQWLSYTRQCNS